ncbi:MAG: PD-(D/E)XK nuclease family protein [Elusimicrobia bacterium]|nr:PD-(D/E)XK nuclease family protein [Elusimicrobiota bacterium]
MQNLELFDMPSPLTPHPSPLTSPRKLSYSSISLYKDCPQRFKFRYIDGIKEKPKSYFSFGQSVHKALEFFYRSQLAAPSLDELLRYYEANWIKEGYESPSQERLQFGEGLRIIKAFYNKHAGGWQPAFATEYSFTLKIDGVDITGKIDRIDKTQNGGLHVIDYKTGKSFAAWRPKQDDQLTLYQMACENTFGLPVEELTLYHLPSLTPMASPRHPDTLVRGFRKEILTVKTSIDKKAFDPNPVEWKCKRCDYRPICPAWTTTPAAPPKPKTELPATPLLARVDQALSQIETIKQELLDVRESLLQKNNKE